LDVTLNPVTSKKIIIGVERDGDCRKLCQIMFLRDGSLTVSFPYFHQSECQLAIGTMPCAAVTPTLKIDKNVWASSHRVKYTHHLDGRAHFSQDGRIRTTVKRQAVPLTSAIGHLFTLSVQGLSDFKALPVDQRYPPSARRANVIFKMAGTPTNSLKIVGRIYERSQFLAILKNPEPPVGPALTLMERNGRKHQGAMISTDGTSERILLLSIHSIPPLNQGRSSIIFIGGFDPPEIINDYSRTSDFLFMGSPVGDFQKLIAEHGTVDFRVTEASPIAS
jgi:hypothetical protein